MGESALKVSRNLPTVCLAAQPIIPRMSIEFCKKWTYPSLSEWPKPQF
jgi:hypothetical protein